jgi:tetrapyrrole methylase family protein/MazG family protein
MIKIVGLGPGDKRFLTMEAHEALQNADALYLRTERHPLVADFKSLGISYSSYDSWYDNYEDFDTLYLKIAEDLIEKSLSGDITYAVPGNPFVAEKTVENLLLFEQQGKVILEIVYGVSFIDAMLTALKKDPVKGLKIIDALNMDQVQITHDADMIFIQCYDRFSASEIKFKLADAFPDDYLVTLVTAAGVKGQETILTIPLYELDHHEDFNHLSSLYVEKPHSKTRFLLEDLIQIMKRLRSDDGCPWDRVQTHETLKAYLIEEAYEVIDAIERMDFMDMEEELGDLLLQIIFHVQIASENGDFSWVDVTTGICDKLIRRHPHVFADWDVHSAEQVLVNWEAIKQTEKEERFVHESMARIPKQLPQLISADKIQKKAAKVGFDWPTVEGAFEKVREELIEIQEAALLGDQAHITEEIGDLLFAVVNCARFLKVDPEFALKKTNTKFIKRFAFVEEKIVGCGKRLEDSTLAEMDDFWNESKKYE